MNISSSTQEGSIIIDFRVRCAPARAPDPKNNIALWWGQTLSSLVCPTNVEVLATFLSSTDGFLYSFNCCSTNFYDPPSQVDEPPSFFFIQLAPRPLLLPPQHTGSSPQLPLSFVCIAFLKLRRIRMNVALFQTTYSFPHRLYFFL